MKRYRWLVLLCVIAVVAASTSRCIRSAARAWAFASIAGRSFFFTTPRSSDTSNDWMAGKAGVSSFAPLTSLPLTTWMSDFTFSAQVTRAHATPNGAT